jgi:hypothetical protein
MKNLKLFVSVILTSLFISSCSDDETGTLDNPTLGAYENGILIANEGNFGTDNSSISYFSGNLETFQLNAFTAANPGEILGNTCQSINFFEDKAYVILNGSNKIKVLNRYTLKLLGTISIGLNNPRYIDFANGKGYVTNWGDGLSSTDDFVAVLNLSSNTITSSISVVEGPEKLIVENNKIYVAHQGAFGVNNKISIINSTSNTVESTLTVGDLPQSLEIKAGFLYVLCSGKPAYTNSETGGKIYKINLANDTENTLTFPATSHPANLDIDNGNIYYTLGNKVFKIAENNFALPTTEIFNTTAQSINSFYGFAAKNDKIYIADAKDNNSAGTIAVYNVTGTLLTQKTVSVSPNGFYFN